MIAWRHLKRPLLLLLTLGNHASAVVAVLLYRVRTCGDFLKIPTPLVDDTHIQVVVENISCKLPRTVIVSGPYAYLVTSDLPSLTLKNLRFSVKDEADTFFHLSTDVYEHQGTIAFVATDPQRSHGGAFKVEAGASLTFAVPMTFSGTSVVAGKRGGAINNNGNLVFERSAEFFSCGVQNPADVAAQLPGPEDPNNTAAAVAAATEVAVAATAGKEGSATVFPWGCGGAVYNGASGQAWFCNVTRFEDNRAGDGSAGGGLCNEGAARFLGRTYFTGNSAADHAFYGRGNGGAMFTAGGAVTTLGRKAFFRDNRSGGVGGAVHNDVGARTTLHGAAVFFGNTALSGWDGGRGGHVFSSGLFEVKGDATFTSGRASQDGGALFVSDSGEATFNGSLTFQDNHAVRECHDVYDASSETVCLSVP